MSTKKNTKETTPAVAPIILTDEEKAAQKLKSCRMYLEAQLEMAQRTMAEFQKKLADNPNNPAYVMDWSMGAFTAAATIEVANIALKMLNAECSILDTKNEVLRYALTSVTRSSSPVASLLSQEKKEAAARIYQDLCRWA